MPVQIGQPRESGFGEPLGLLSDCHRRIERFLAVLNRVAAECAGRRLSVEEQSVFENALRYFREAAPRHTADEEESLFPRLRSSKDPAARTTLDSLAALEADHSVAARDHGVVDALGRKWMDAGRLSAEEHRTLGGALGRLSKLYARHIVVEDAELFPLAARVLQPEDLASIGKEMAARRGLPR
jgi:hemerythrin-like domain-containing protein